MLVLIVLVLAFWPFSLTTAQQSFTPQSLTAQPDRPTMYVTPDGIIGAQEQLVGYQLVPADEPYIQQPSLRLEQPFLDKLANLFLQQSIPQKPAVGSARYGGRQTSTLYQTSYGELLPGLHGQNILVSGQPKSGYNSQQTGGHAKKRQKVKTVRKPVYVPVPIKKEKKKKKKSKTLSVSKGFYIGGGSEIFGKFKTLKSCQKACDNTAHCLAGDYNKWTKRCYTHSSATACNPIQPHKQLTHFKKVPCTGTDAGIRYSRITLGSRLDHGLLQKGIKNIQTCIKKCLQAGGGVPPRINMMNTMIDNGVNPPEPNIILDTPQLCFGIDYDFSSHKCYFHTSVTVFNTLTAAGVLTGRVLLGIPGGIICLVQSALTQPLAPASLVADASVVNIVICPDPN